MEVSFLELKSKQVINTVDGKCLGHITDIIFDAGCAKLLGFIVPQSNSGFWGIFRGSKDIFIPFNCVCKIGVDVILVELYVEEKSSNNVQNSKYSAEINRLTPDKDKIYN